MEVKHANKELLDFYDGMATTSEIDEANVSKEDFFEITHSFSQSS